MKTPKLILAMALLSGGIWAEDYPPETTFVSVEAAPFERPQYLEASLDPVFGNPVTRITDAKVFGYENPRHGYSKNQPWNMDQSYLRIRDRLLDGKTYQLLRKFPYLDEAKWSHTHPQHMFGFQGKGRFVRLSLPQDEIEVLRVFEGYDEVRMGPWEGNLSYDDAWVVFAARKGQDLTVIVYNIPDDKIESQKIFPQGWKRLDWVSISPSGTYVVFNWHPDAEIKGKVIDCYDLKLSFLRRLADQSGHGDMGYAEDGTELYAQFEFADQRGIWAYELHSGKRIRLLPDKYNGGHLSFQNTRRPGWCYLSCNKKGYSQVFALKTDGSGIVNRFAHHYSVPGAYGSEVQAVPNQEGTKVVFASNWNGEADVNSFVVEVKHEKD
ncbi:hypothetical protein P0Y35_13845 [Kiritimatiellaeota bacterium B1221]|nr:hypothetical protein [Kiritimatiellaeota bacterium B1221]